MLSHDEAGSIRLQQAPQFTVKIHNFFFRTPGNQKYAPLRLFPDALKTRPQR